MKRLAILIVVLIAGCAQNEDDVYDIHLPMCATKGTSAVDSRWQLRDLTMAGDSATAVLVCSRQ